MINSLLFLRPSGLLCSLTHKEGSSIFRLAAASVDPLRSPQQALDAAVHDLRLVESLLPEGQVEESRLPRPLVGCNWDSEAYTDVVTGVGRTPLDEAFEPYVPGADLPSAVSGVGGPGIFQVLAHQEPFVQMVQPTMPQVKSRRRKRRHHQSDVQTVATMAESQPDLPTVGAVVETTHPTADAFDPEEMEEVPVEPLFPQTTGQHTDGQNTEAPLPEKEVARGRPVVADTAPAPKKQKRSATPKKRKSRWDPEEAPQITDRTSRLQFVFVPPPGLPSDAIPALTKVVSTLQGVLKNYNTRQIDIVITTKDKDPFLFAGVQNFGQVLQQFALQSRLSLLSYGKAWVAKYVDQEASQESVTLFLHVDLVQRYAPNEPVVGPSWKQKPQRSRSPPFRPSPGAASSDKKVFSPQVVLPRLLHDLSSVAVKAMALSLLLALTFCLLLQWLLLSL